MHIVTEYSERCPYSNMPKHIRYIRLLLIALGLFTVLVSFVAICRATALLRAVHGDSLFNASIVAFLLGILLALGGGCLALRGRNYGISRA